MSSKTTPAWDARSERVVLLYRGDSDAHLSGVPARDLTEHDLCRLAFVREVEPAAVVADLIAAGLYAPANTEG